MLRSDFEKANEVYNKIKKRKEETEYEINYKNRIIDSLRGQRICSVNINSCASIKISALSISCVLTEEVKELEENLVKMDKEIDELLK